MSFIFNNLFLIIFIYDYCCELLFFIVSERWGLFFY